MIIYTQTISLTWLPSPFFQNKWQRNDLLPRDHGNLQTSQLGELSQHLTAHHREDHLTSLWCIWNSFLLACTSAPGNSSPLSLLPSFTYLQECFPLTKQAHFSIPVFKRPHLLLSSATFFKLSPSLWRCGTALPTMCQLRSWQHQNWGPIYRACLQVSSSLSSEQLDSWAFQSPIPLRTTT